jgi:hypothetical protein
MRVLKTGSGIFVYLKKIFESPVETGLINGPIVSAKKDLITLL